MHKTQRTNKNVSLSIIRIHSLNQSTLIKQYWFRFLFKVVAKSRPTLLILVSINLKNVPVQSSSNPKLPEKAGEVLHWRKLYGASSSFSVAELAKKSGLIVYVCSEAQHIQICLLYTSPSPRD